MESWRTTDTGSDGESYGDRSTVVQYDGSGAPRPSVAVVELVADVRDCYPTSLAPLHSVVDPDALDALVAGGRDPADGPRVAFEYEGVTVEVRDDGGLVVATSEQ